MNKCRKLRKHDASRLAGLSALFFTILLLAGCGGGDDDGSDDSTDTDISAATATLSTPSGDALDIHSNIVITFDEAMDPNSLVLGEDLGAISDGGTWNADNTVLTISPDEMGAWESGDQSLALSVSDTSGNATDVNASFAVDFVLNTFQPAQIVIGQANFTGKAANQGGTAAVDTLQNPTGDPMVIDGRLWVVDATNSRVLGYDGIPAANGASASWVIGQSTFTDSGTGTSASMLVFPADIAYDDTTFYISDIINNRVLIYDGVPLSPPGAAAHVLGQADMNSAVQGCSASLMTLPSGIIAVAGKLIVAEDGNSRVLIWNSPPTDADNIPPDLVLGQSDFTHCMRRDDNQDGTVDTDATARALSHPGGVWSDGKRLLVADSDNNRILVWNSFPASNFQPADVVIGQSDFANHSGRDDNGDGSPDALPTARTLNYPSGVWSNGRQIIVVDSSDNRVLLWNSFPTSNFQPADAVLGQAIFTAKQYNDDNNDDIADATPSARTLRSPWGLGVYRDKLLVSDSANNRVLVFESN